MATYEREGEPATRGAASALGRLAVVAAMALVETVALWTWLTLVRDAPVVSPATAAGFGVLTGGLVVRFVLATVAVDGPAGSLPGSRAVTVVLSETALWGVWLLTVTAVGGLAGFAVGGGAFAALLVFQHTVVDSVLRGRRLLSRLVDFDALGFSLVQAGGATLWLLFDVRGDLVAPSLADADAAFGTHLPVDVAAVDPSLVGLSVLATALFVEHFVGVSFSRHGDRTPGAPSSNYD